MKRAMLFIDGSLIYKDWNKLQSALLPDLPHKSFKIQSLRNQILEQLDNCTIEKTFYFASESKKNASILSEINNVDFCEVIKGRYQGSEDFFDSTKEARKAIICPNCNHKIEPSSEDRKEEYHEKRTDINMTVEMIRQAINNAYDFALIMTRDEDFYSAINYIKSLGKQTVLIRFEKNKDCPLGSKYLENIVDNTVYIDPITLRNASINKV